MPYLIFNTKDDAVQRSREAWEAVLGRKKKPEDVTEFLWSIDVGNDGRTAIVINEKADLLTASEEIAKTETLDTNWSKDVAFP